MSKLKPSEERRLPPPENRHKGKGRGKNFEAADQALRERIAQSEAEAARRGHPQYRSYLRHSLPEVEVGQKNRLREKRATKCVCGHRGDKHTYRHQLNMVVDEVLRCTTYRTDRRPCLMCNEECLDLTPK